MRMGIITNGFVELQQERLATHQFEQFFQFVVVSEALGVAKPHPEIFSIRIVSISEEVPTSRILMVGDNPYSDILGGQRAGWHTCWLNEHQATCPEELNRIIPSSFKRTDGIGLITTSVPRVFYSHGSITKVAELALFGFG